MIFLMRTLVALLSISRCVCFVPPSSTASTLTTQVASCARRLNRYIPFSVDGVNRGGLEVLLRGESRARSAMINPRRREAGKVCRNVRRQLGERETDAETEAAFERELERDAAAWVNGNPDRQELWERAQKWLKFSKLRRAREEALSELERDKLRYVLKDVQAVTGLPLVNGREITPLAWGITLCIQLMPIAALYLVFTALATDNPHPVLEVSKPFWAGS